MRSRNIKKRKTNRKFHFRTILYPEIPESPEDLIITTRVGDRIDNLAARAYGNSNLWWVITTANGNVIDRDSFFIKPGTEIRIPADLRNILKKYDQINK